MHEGQRSRTLDAGASAPVAWADLWHRRSVSREGALSLARFAPPATRTRPFRFSRRHSSPTALAVSTTSRAFATSRRCSHCWRTSGQRGNGTGPAPVVVGGVGERVQGHGANTGEVDTSRAEPKPLDPALCKEIRASILL